MMNILLTIDGLSVVRRIFEANPEPDLTARAKEAVQSALSSVRRLLSQHHPTHVLVAIDAGGHTWRHALHPLYHEKREAMAPELLDHLDEFAAGLAAMGVSCVEVAGVEADDVIATAVTRWLGEQKGGVIIASTSKNLLALTGRGARIWHYAKTEWRDAAWVNSHLGIAPEQLADYLALVGNKDKGIPGVAGIGQKKAAALLHRYGSLDGVMAGAGILVDKLGAALRREKAQAYLSRQLVTLKIDVILGVTWKRLAVG